MARIDATLRDARSDTEPGDAEALMAHVLDRSTGWLFAHGDETLAPGDAQAFAELLRRRRAGEPVAYLVGRRGFWRFDVQVSPATLIPRPETELLVELALERMPADRDLAVADLGTGSGVIALALALERPRARIVAVDASPQALDVARCNAQALAVTNVSFSEGDWFAPIVAAIAVQIAPERFDLIVSNPPYIAEDDPHLGRGDLRHEPRQALASGPQGLDAIRVIAGGAPRHLQPGGWLLVEHGWEQGAAVRDAFATAGLVEVRTVQDLERRDRVTLGRAPA
jgi:release factor glutamine methyltransferase